MSEVISQWIQAGALGILGFVLWYGMKNVLPQFTKAIDRISDVLQRQEMVLGRLTVVVLQHDATVRGENPETLGTSEELLERILKVR